MMYLEIMDKIALLLSKKANQRISRNEIKEFKELLILLRDSYNQNLCREMLIRQYFGEADTEQKRRVVERLRKLQLKLGLKVNEVNRYFQRLETDARQGEVFKVCRKEILTYYVINDNNSEKEVIQT